MNVIRFPSKYTCHCFPKMAQFSQAAARSCNTQKQSGFHQIVALDWFLYLRWLLGLIMCVPSVKYLLYTLLDGLWWMGTRCENTKVMLRQRLRRTFHRPVNLSPITDQNYKDTHITFVCDSSQGAEKVTLMPKSDSSCWHFSSWYLDVQLFSPQKDYHF